MNIFDKFKNLIGYDKDEDLEQDVNVDYNYDIKELEEDNVIKPSFFSNKKYEERKNYSDLKNESEDNSNYRNYEKIEKNNRIDRTEKIENRKTIYSADIKITVPVSFEDATNIIDDIKNRRAVILNTTNLEIKTAQRLLDFVSGAVYALKGEIKEIMEGVYVITPENIKISDDISNPGFKSMFGFK